MKKTTLKLPRLRTKEELLKTSPDLFSKLLGDDMSSARSTSPSQTKHTIRPLNSTSGATQPSRVPVKAAGQLFDTPRGFEEETVTDDHALAVELDSVKRERQSLLESIAHVKAEAGTAGGEAQQADIRQLLTELELKKSKLNELKGESRRLENTINKLRDDNTDAERLTPGDMLEENVYIQGLRDEMQHIDDDLLEAEAKNRLYYLLGERTRHEHLAIDQKVRDKQESKRNCMEDWTNLSEHYNATRAAKELAEKELAKVRRQVEEARQDWMKKIRERRGEVRELKKRQQKDRDKDVKRREKMVVKERAERESQAKLKMEQEAYELQVAALAPKIEAMEASWNRLRTVSGAETPEDVIDFWEGLKSKEQRMKDLVKLAERREAACKEEIARLLASRSAMYESNAAAAAATADQATELGASTGDEADSVEVTHRIDTAEKRMMVAQTKFNKLRSVCVAADQGLRSLLERLMIALEEAPPLSARSPVASPPPAAKNHHGATAGAGHGGATIDRRSGGGMRDSRSPGAGSLRQGRSTRENTASPADSLASKSSRTRLAQGGQAAVVDPAAERGNLADVPEGPEVGSGRSSVQPWNKTAETTAHSIEDDTFFPALPDMLHNISDRLDKIMAAGEAMDLATLRARASALMSGNTTARTDTSSVSASAAGGTGLGHEVNLNSPTGQEGVNDSFMESSPRAGGEEEGDAMAEADEAAAGDEEGNAAGGEEGDAVENEGQEAGAEAADHAEGDTAENDEAAGGEQAGVESEPTDANNEQQDGEPQDGEQATEGAGDDAAGVEKDTQPNLQESDANGIDSTDNEQQAGAGATDGAEQTQESSSATEHDNDGAETAADNEKPRPATVDSRPSSGVARPALAAKRPESAANRPASAANRPASAANRPTSAANRPASAANGSGSAAGAAAPAVKPATPSLPPIPADAHDSHDGGFMSNSGRSTHRSEIIDVPGLPIAAIAAVEGNTDAIPVNERALMKGLQRRTWTGAPWLDTISQNPLESMVPSMKRKKGKRKEAMSQPDLNRILGYVPADVEAESESEPEDDEEGGEGVLDRDWIKMRAAKMMARHNAKQQQMQQLR
eukprot:jgi/Chrzof1/8940/Cz03g30020.t1